MGKMRESGVMCTDTVLGTWWVGRCSWETDSLESSASWEQ